MLNLLFTSFSIYFFFKNNFSYEANKISNNIIIYKLLISTALNELAVAKFEALSQHFDFLVYRG
jgi:hypothetical protein